MAPAFEGAGVRVTSVSLESVFVAFMNGHAFGARRSGVNRWPAKRRRAGN
jgi:hypothetical protein